jgi:DNA gyrase subunit B
MTEPVEVVDGIDAIRRRPAMYVGDVDGNALHHVLWELVANSIDEHLAGFATRLRVVVGPDVAEIEDNGRGIPIELVEQYLTTISMRPTRDDHLPHVHISPLSFPGVGMVIANALSEELELEVRRDGYAWRQRCARGRVCGPLTRGEATERSGTQIRFRPDRTIFPPHVCFDAGAVGEHLGKLAMFNRALTISFESVMREPDGLASWVRRLAAARQARLDGDVFLTEGTIDSVVVQAAIGWSERSAPPLLRSFVRQNRTRDGGTHEQGFWDGLIRAVLSHGKNKRRPRASRERIGPGLIAVLHVGLLDPEFGSPTMDRLASPRARRAVSEHLAMTYGDYLAQRPSLANKLSARLG